MAHYWNPTNYNNSADLVIPLELANPEVYDHKLNNMGILYNAVKKEYPFEVNVPQRMYNNPKNFVQEDFIQNNKDYLNPKG